MADDHPIRIRDVLGGLGRSLGFRHPVQVGWVWAQWPDIVGADIAQHAEPSSLRDGVLRVRTENPVWATEIGYLVEDIKDRVNRASKVDLVSEVRVWTGPGPIRVHGAPKPSPKAAVPDPGTDPGTSPRTPSEASPEEALEAARRA